MNDEFLTQFHAPPREAFAEALKVRLSTIKSKKPAHTLRWIGLGFATICVVFVVLFVNMPSVRAVTLNIVREIAGLNFDDSMSVNPDVVMARPTPSNLDQIAREISRTVSVPTWIPTGFTLQGDPYLSKGQLWPNDWEVLILWSNSNQKVIQFSMAKRLEGPGTTQNVGPTAMEEVTVNGQPAAFARGVWILELDPNTGKPKDQLTKTDMNQLFWSKHGLRYNILSQDPSVSLEDLIRMAESVK